jgi:hypothetical protein
MTGKYRRRRERIHPECDTGVQLYCVIKDKKLIHQMFFENINILFKGEIKSNNLLR